jgi:hypothetical protein
MVVGGSTADVTGRAWHDPVRLSIDGTADTAYPHDLRLQQYAKDLGDDMRAALPHRIGSAELPWAGTWLDQWSLDVVCASVVESVDVDAEDWTAYRNQVEVRREAVRAQAAEELGREPLWLCVLHVIQAEAPTDRCVSQTYSSCSRSRRSP